MCFYDLCDLVTFQFWWHLLFCNIFVWRHLCVHPSSISHPPSSIIWLIAHPPLGKAGWARHSWSWTLITTTHYRLKTTKEFLIRNPVEASLLDGLVNHTLSIWWEIEFTSDIFLKTSVCVDYWQIIFKKQIKSMVQSSVRCTVGIWVVHTLIWLKLAWQRRTNML